MSLSADVPCPRATSLSRRAVVVALAGAAASLASGCDPATPGSEHDPLRPLLEAARADATAFAASVGDGGTDSTRVRALGEARRRHAERLAAEINRLDPGTTSPTVQTAPSSSSPSSLPPTEVSRRLREAAVAAARTAESLDGYRAGLVASIAASCTAAAEVTLA